MNFIIFMRSALKRSHQIYANISSSGFVVFCLIICKVLAAQEVKRALYFTCSGLSRMFENLLCDFEQPWHRSQTRISWVEMAGYVGGKGGRRRGEECGHIRWCFWKGMPAGCAYFCSLHINYGFFWMKRSHLWHWSEKFSGSEFGKKWLNESKFQKNEHSVPHVAASVCLLPK